jgi:hypothetical protein
MAQAGDDIRLVQMLLDVAADLDAEAEAIEAEQHGERRLRPDGTIRARWAAADTDMEPRPVQIVDISLNGARLRADTCHHTGSRVVLELPGEGLHLCGTIIRACDQEAAIAFDDRSRSAPELARFVHSGVQSARLPAFSQG